VSVIIPCYREVWWRSGQEITTKGWKLWIPLGDREVEARVHESRLPGSSVAVYLIDQPNYFDRDQLYQQSDGRDYPDNAERFAFFAKAALETISRLEARPDVIHCHDWQAALIPAKLAEHYSPWMDGVGTLLTVHNLAYQGVFDADTLALTGLDRRLFNWRQLEFHGRLSYLKAGLVYADRLSTVSPTYAREIQTPAFGCGLDGLLRSRSADLTGIVNGIDPTLWSPATESVLAARYDVTTFESGKAVCKAALQRRAGLPERAALPLFAQIGRFDPQKGWDLLIDVADDLLSGDVQLVVLGHGQRQYHERLERLAARFPDKLRVFVEFSGPLAHQIEAGADLFLMPSLYEPCGLNQLYSLAHGTVPVVRATGGLCDTVVDVTPAGLACGSSTGFVFRDPTPGALREAIDRALGLRADRRAWRRLVENGMRADWSWQRSARSYVTLYDEVRRHATARAGHEASLAMAI
jgi:starch synthase